MGADEFKAALGGAKGLTIYRLRQRIVRLEAENAQIRVAVDHLWGWMPAEQVEEILSDEPELAELCKKVHHDLWHATTHEQRMMARGSEEPDGE